MSTPTTIVVPGLAAVLEEFLRPRAATSGDGVEIRQDETGTTVSACEGRHAATIRTTAAGRLEPILVDPAALAGGDPAGELKLYRMAETSAVVVQAGGELATVVIAPGAPARSARDLADVVEGEIASGMTKAVFELDPRHLLAIARGLVAAGVEKTTVTFAPRWNVLAVAGETDTISATFLVAGESFEQEPKKTAVEADDPLDFTIGQTKRGGGRALRPAVTSNPDHELPF
jgi:hypothetical protein